MWSRMRDERGLAISVWIVMIVPAVVLMFGVAYDLAGQFAAKRHAYEVAAQAARVAGQQIDTDTYMSGQRVVVDSTRARSAAVAYIRSNGMIGSATMTSSTTLTVIATATYRPAFLSGMGIGDLTVTSEASIDTIRTLEGHVRR
jgi:hypothetical protein